LLLEDRATTTLMLFEIIAIIRLRTNFDEIIGTVK